MLDVHQQQLLVLLLVMEPELDERRRRLVNRTGEQALHPGIDVFAISRAPSSRRGSGEQPAHRSGMSSADRFVIGVEQVAEAPDANGS